MAIERLETCTIKRVGPEAVSGKDLNPRDFFVWQATSHAPYLVMKKDKDGSAISVSLLTGETEKVFRDTFVFPIHPTITY